MRKITLGTICIHGWRAINGTTQSLSDQDKFKDELAGIKLSNLAEEEGVTNLAPGQWKGISTARCICCDKEERGEHWPLYATVAY